MIAQNMNNDSTGEFAHFLAAQSPIYDQVAAELAGGEKRSHWMWFIFPQVKGLGSSAMARKFALSSLEEAKAYTAHPLLGRRLRECTKLVLDLKDRAIPDIFGFPDDLKFHSSITLFVLAVPEEPLFELTLAKYFDGRKDLKTAELLGLKNGR